MFIKLHTSLVLTRTQAVEGCDPTQPYKKLVHILDSWRAATRNSRTAVQDSLCDQERCKRSFLTLDFFQNEFYLSTCFRLFYIQYIQSKQSITDKCMEICKRKSVETQNVYFIFFVRLGKISNLIREILCMDVIVSDPAP